MGFDINTRHKNSITSLFLFPFLRQRKKRSFLYTLKREKADKTTPFFLPHNYMNIAFNLITSGLLAFDKTYIDNILIK